MPSQENWLLPDITTSQNLANGALSFTTTIAKKFKLQEILITFKDVSDNAVPVTETITITIDSAKGASYDTIKAKRSLISESSFVYRPGGHADYQSGDEIKIQCTNANVTGIAYVVVKIAERF